MEKAGNYYANFAVSGGILIIGCTATNSSADTEVDKPDDFRTPAYTHS